MALSAPVIYECKINAGATSGGYISPVIILTHDEATGAIIVNDGVIQAFIGEPIPAKLSRETTSRRSYSWAVRTENEHRQKTRMMYVLDLEREGASRAAKVRARPAGFDNVFTAQGSCTVTQG